MADLVLGRAQRLALLLQSATLLQLNGDDLRRLAHLLDAHHEVDAERSAAFARFMALVNLAPYDTFAQWADDLDNQSHMQLVQDAELALGLTIEPRPTGEKDHEAGGQTE